jgi:hypothetical protein
VATRCAGLAQISLCLSQKREQNEGGNGQSLGLDLVAASPLAGTAKNTTVAIKQDPASRESVLASARPPPPVPGMHAQAHGENFSMNNSIFGVWEARRLEPCRRGAGAAMRAPREAAGPPFVSAFSLSVGQRQNIRSILWDCTAGMQNASMRSIAPPLHRQGRTRNVVGARRGCVTFQSQKGTHRSGG